MRTKILGFVVVVVTLALAGALALIQPAQAATVSKCNKYDTVNINGKVYVVQNNVWNDVDGSQCISVDNVTGNFKITSANHNKPTNGAPAGYPSIFKGCHWGNCTINSGMPVRVSALSSAITSWSTTQPGSGTYNAAYDIWFNKQPTTGGQPNGAELMIWLNSRGGVQPAGSKVASVSINGATWNVWKGKGSSGWNIISYVRATGTTSVSNFNLLAFIKDAVSRGSIQTAWYLIDVEAGFEPWVSGAGLGSSGFSVAVAGG